MRATAVALLLLAVPVFAQRYDDAITVNVVEVPVYVERFLRPVAGLTRDDFELFVDGKRQPIEYLDVIEEKASRPVADGTSAPVAAASIAPAAELKRRRLAVLLFDVGGSSAHALHRAREEAMRFVQQGGPGDTYAVATIGARGVRFIVPFTTDHVSVQRAIRTLRPSSAGDPFRVATLDTERAVPVDFFRLQEQHEPFFADELFIGELVDLADRLVALEGVKHVVLLSERRGIGDGVFWYAGMAARLHERYREAGVILDGVDIRPPWAPGGVEQQSGSSARPDLYPSPLLYTLALETGGTVTASLRQLEERNSITYVLGFRPPRHVRSGTHSIQVRVKNAPFLTEVRHRRSFTIGSERRGDDALFLADTILNDIPHRGVTVDVDVEGTTVEARIPGAELLAHPAYEPLPLEVFLYVFGEKGEAVDWTHMKLRVDLAAGREFLEKHPYTIRRKFDLPPGSYSAKALVRILNTDMLGFRRTDFVVE